MPFASGNLIGGRYTLERTLGRGGTATVWLVSDAVSGDHVAMKLLHEDLAESSVRARFAREARRTATLTHPRIVPVLDAGDAGETLYFTQPYMTGGTLRERLTRERQLDVPTALRIGQDIAGALAHAHAKGFIHRDVKPENILFAEDEAYLADFGISQAMEASLDESTYSRLVVRGTLPYMSPEQASGLNDLDGRSDIFALGSVLYECLTGVPAFQGGSPDIIMAQVIGSEPRPLAELRPQVSSELVDIIGTCMAKAPGDRFQDAAALAEALANPDRRRSRTAREREALAATARQRAERQRRLRVRFAIATAAMASIMVAAAFLSDPLSRWSATATSLDTTRVLLFPIESEREGSAATDIDDQLLRSAFLRGEGIALVPQLIVADRLAQIASAHTTLDRGAVARELGAGRFVRARVSGDRGGRRATVALIETRSGDPLFEHSFTLPERPIAAAAEWSRAATVLMLRSTRLPPGSDQRAEGFSVPALQSYTRGHAALADWDLALADSMFATAQATEPDDPATQFWLAQVRAWSRRPRGEWSGLATRAAGAPVGLDAREGRLAQALAALGEQRFTEACSAYRALVNTDSTDYAGWFGLGQCHYLDGLVVPYQTPLGAGWRFRSSYHQAFIAFERALRLLPTIHKGLQLEGFEGKGMYVLRGSEIRLGRNAAGEQFAGRLAWQGDSLVLVPVPLGVLAAGGADATPPGFDEALRRQRLAFREMARRWSSAFPTGSEAKAAVALALELNGIPSAIDTIRAARRLARTERERSELALVETRLLLRFGLPDDLVALRRLRALADSLLDLPDARRPAAGEALEAVAIIRGRCDDALRIARGREGVELLGVPEGPGIEAREVLDHVVMRCDPLSDARRARDLLRHLDDDPMMGQAHQRPHLLRSFLLRPTLLMTRRDPELVQRLASELDDPILRAAHAVNEREIARARALLLDFDAMENPLMPMSPDYAFIVARLWADVGDGARARQILESQLQRIRMTDPFYLREPGNVGSLLRAASWRGQLAAADGDRRTAQRWQNAIAVLQGR